ncbi:Amidophosphoribosyltransferase precursor [Aedoeadaptatus ivorii]|uniref:Amidophosphoribosyltransferase n=1 Tax=Aedoeadaptatus ivorii TaxID=54006 RepID=A0A3S5AK29_9FIRM|nr:amidophosphoribosyltransferase [Peptoniphilus ivorii]VEJ36098.1 Amidophosphoribosyltransferase precursor [Peptoniphilus ivorii]
MSGVIGIYSNNAVSPSLFYGLNSLQHRGQESAGMAVFNGEEILRKRAMGLVIDGFDEETLAELPGNIGIGHVRYSKAGGAHDYNIQPVMGFIGGETIAIAHDGNLVNYQLLRARLEEEGMMFQTTNDTEVILYLITRYYESDIVEAIRRTMDVIEGAYSVTALMKGQVVAFRDPSGFRPLVLGRDGDDVIVASENAPIEIIGGEMTRNVEAGEILVIDETGIHSYPYEGENRARNCIFEYVYFARNDANLDDINAYTFRRRCGEILWKEAPCDVDLVVPVPDSGIPSAIGYAQASGIPFGEGLVKNRYMGRTFIKPTQKEREMAVKLKLNPLVDVVRGKSIVLLDDSIVRGTTSRNLIHRLREAGAKEVHMRITSPPVKYSCYYGIDTPNRKNLIAANQTIREIEENIGADSLAFISLEGLASAGKKEISRYCTACFDGDYPVDPTVI